jgi:hypothetical protein
MMMVLLMMIMIMIIMINIKIFISAYLKVSAFFNRLRTLTLIAGKKDKKKSTSFFKKMCEKCGLLLKCRLLLLKSLKSFRTLYFYCLFSANIKIMCRSKYLNIFSVYIYKNKYLFINIKCLILIITII